MSKGVDSKNHSVEEVVEIAKKVLADKALLAYLFGGRACGYRLKGDYDIAVLLKNGCNPLELGYIQSSLVQALDVGDEDVDVLCLDSLPPDEALKIVYRGIPIVEDEEAKAVFVYREAVEFIDVQEALSLIEKL